MKQRKIVIKQSPQEVIRAASSPRVFGRGNAAGVHADQKGRYGKRQRATLRRQERNARLGNEE